MSLFARARRAIRGLAKDALLIANRLRFHLFFPDQPADGEYCSSKRIRLIKEPPAARRRRPYLAIVRCGPNHLLIDDGGERNFDIALSAYAQPHERFIRGCEYTYAGGVNKYKAARQFVDDALLHAYRGFILLDDDLEMTYSDLSRFLDHCWAHGLRLAQPSLSPDSFGSHAYLFNASPTGFRSVEIVEVMCPYFARDALRVALPTFDLSYSTWGLDFVWPRLLNLEPVVVDDFRIKHTRPVGRSDSGLYSYLRGIGVSPQREENKLRRLSDEQIRALTDTRMRS